MFKLQTKMKPAGDQPQAIEKLTDGLQKGLDHQTLLGVTGSGKTFTVAQVIQKVQRPTLVIAHNKTLAAQLCQEFREFFPENQVSYFVSYYDYYQPEAYLPRTDTYIDKESMINEEIDRLRHAATQSLLTRKDVIVVASVSCIYSIGSPEWYERASFAIERGQTLLRTDILRTLVFMQYARTQSDLTRGTFRLRGQVLEIMPPHFNTIYRIEMVGQEVRRIEETDPVSRKVREDLSRILLFPTKHFVTPKPEVDRALRDIRTELKEQLGYFQKVGKLLEIERLERRTRFDLEMIKEVGYCHGVENYSRHFEGRAPGAPPQTLLEYFSKNNGSDWLLVVDESHVTIPQVGGMYEGDKARKKTLVEYGFRLPSAMDNRPLKFTEFEARMPQMIYLSATPGRYELEHSKQVVEQVIRPTGLVDPEIIIAPITGGSNSPRPPLKVRGGEGGVMKSQIDDVIERIRGRVKQKERVIVTTLTKKMAEDLSSYLAELKIKARYLHSEVDTLDRITTLMEFRKGTFDVLVGVNLLREGLDLPEVSLVAILDADKEGFLRSETSLIQTIGRAARNVHGQVVLYADVMTGSIKRAVGETERRRKLQLEYNKKHGITPRTIKKRVRNLLEDFGIVQDEKTHERKNGRTGKALNLELAVDDRPVEAILKEKEAQMKKAANELEFELAALLRDEIQILKQALKKHGRQSRGSTGSPRPSASR
ncbi:MAG: excinuclease ABC subunit UvrB [Patescibacteria group bacterium]